MARHTIRVHFLGSGPSRGRELSRELSRVIQTYAREQRNGAHPGGYCSDPAVWPLSVGELRVDAFDRSTIRAAGSAIAHWANTTGFSVDVTLGASARQAIDPALYDNRFARFHRS